MLLGEGSPHERKGERGALPSKRRYSTAIGSSNVKMIAERHRQSMLHIITNTEDELLRNVNNDNFI